MARNSTTFQILPQLPNKKKTSKRPSKTAILTSKFSTNLSIKVFFPLFMPKHTSNQLQLFSVRFLSQPKKSNWAILLNKEVSRTKAREGVQSPRTTWVANRTQDRPWSNAICWITLFAADEEQKWYLTNFYWQSFKLGNSSFYVVFPRNARSSLQAALLSLSCVSPRNVDPRSILISDSLLVSSC